MKNLIIIFTALVLTGSLSFGQDTEADTDAPVMDFEFGTHDFGELNEGDDAEIDFTFTNTGNKNLILTNVKASCGCTTPYWSKEPVAPGETGKITAKYSTKNRSGSFNKAITITSNANPGTQRIFIKGNVKKAPANDGVPERAPSIVNQLADE